jgi:hypothetical protein
MIYDPFNDVHILSLVVCADISVDYVVYGFHATEGEPHEEGRVEMREPEELNECEYPAWRLQFLEFPIYGVRDVTVRVCDDIPSKDERLTYVGPPGRQPGQRAVTRMARGRVIQELLVQRGGIWGSSTATLSRSV